MNHVVDWSEPPLDASRADYRILVVEDDEVDARLLTRHLRGLPARPTVVDRLSDAVEQFDAGGFDCVVADLGLSDAWPAISSEWYADLARRHVPVVVVSGSRLDVRSLRERCPWLPFVFAKEDLDGPTLRLFVAAAVWRGQALAHDRAAT